MTLPTQTQAVRTVDVVRRGQTTAARDVVAVELPLEVRLNGEPLAIIMRTPGGDRELSLGFLFSEGLVRSRDDVRRVDVEEGAGFCNVLFVRGRDEAVAEALAERRQVTTNSSCGLCGRRTLASLAVAAPVSDVEWSIETDAVSRFPDALRAAQPAFALTGGLHAAGLFDVGGQPEATAEDVGRHNAVDKLIGRMLTAGRLPLTRSVLFVSGRASYEIVQKAWLAGIPFVAAVSAPSSLAIDLARTAGITLMGFVREGRFNIYTHPERVAPT
jgi:FdhD protein